MYLLFCTAATTHAADWQSRTGLAPVMGTHYLVADNPLGPYRLSTPRFLAGDADGLALRLASWCMRRAAGGYSWPSATWTKPVISMVN